MSTVTSVDLAARSVQLTDGRRAAIIQMFALRGDTTQATCVAVSGVAEADADEFYAFEIFPSERAQ